MANSKKSRKPGKRSKEAHADVASDIGLRLLTSAQGTIIGFKECEDETSIYLRFAYGLGMAENMAGFVFNPIQLYDETQLLRVFKANAGFEMSVPGQIRDAYEKKMRSTGLNQSVHQTEPDTE